MDPIAIAMIAFVVGGLAVYLFRAREYHSHVHVYLWQEDDDEPTCEDGEEWRYGRGRED